MPKEIVIDKVIRGDKGDNILPIITRKSAKGTTNKLFRVSSKDVNNNLDIYLGEPELSLNPNVIRISYIAKPVKVKYNLDTGGKNVDSDMPEHLHEDIVRHAVELWQAAIANSIVSENNRQRQNQYENVRNTNRNEYN